MTYAPRPQNFLLEVENDVSALQETLTFPQKKLLLDVQQDVFFPFSRMGSHLGKGLAWQQQGSMSQKALH